MVSRRAQRANRIPARVNGHAKALPATKAWPSIADPQSQWMLNAPEGTPPALARVGMLVSNPEVSDRGVIVGMTEKLCIIQHEDGSQTAQEWDGVSIAFVRPDIRQSAAEPVSHAKIQIGNMVADMNTNERGTVILMDRLAARIRFEDGTEKTVGWEDIASDNCMPDPASL